MNWKEIVGQDKLISTFKESIKNNRIAHAQLFVGEEGYGTLALALAYAKEVLAKENEKSQLKVESLNHLDLHFSFPVYTKDEDSTSKRFYQDWREMILENPYANLQDFGRILEAKNKQLFISADEVMEWAKVLSLKSHEGGTKILIVWRADKMNDQASNKFLKLLEEPPQKTFIFLLADKAENVLATILSRCQVVEVPRIDDESITEALKSDFDYDENILKDISYQAQGDYNIALKIAEKGMINEEFEEFFIAWVRNAFQAKKKPQVLKDIILWAKEIAEWNRDKQKDFLNYCLEIFRLALMQNYGAQEIVYKKLTKNNFKWEGFYKYVHGANIQEILEEISEADIHLYRNAHAKLLWTDLGIKLIRYIHKN